MLARKKGGNQIPKEESGESGRIQKNNFTSPNWVHDRKI
jgi:hypothetical protein